MGYVFISYSSVNRAKTDQLLSVFRKNAIESWVAPDDIPVGSEYAGVINKAIKNCACFVLLLSKDSMHSQWVAKEVERAIHYQKPIIPVQLESVVLTDQFELYISTNQILPISRFDESQPEVQRLIAVVQKYVRASSYQKESLDQDSPHTGNTPSAAPSRQKANYMPIAIVAICAVLVIAVLAATTLIPLLSRGNDNSQLNAPPADTGASTTTSAPATTEASTEASTAGTTEPETTAAKERNEIPSVYDDKIEELKGASELALRNSTIRVKVGQSVVPFAAQVWTNATVYSQDTSIAVGEGTSIKGVSKGETYIILEATLGIAQAYYVIVE